MVLHTSQETFEAAPTWDNFREFYDANDTRQLMRRMGTDPRAVLRSAYNAGYREASMRTKVFIERQQKQLCPLQEAIRFVMDRLRTIGAVSNRTEGQPERLVPLPITLQIFDDGSGSVWFDIEKLCEFDSLDQLAEWLAGRQQDED